MASAEQVQASQHTQQRTTAHQSRRLTLDSRLDAHGYRETATIIPLGRFSYHPDSGYRGYAASVQLQHQDIRTQQRIFFDSAQHLHRTTATVSDSAVTTETHAVEQREQYGIAWRWLGMALLLVLIVGFLARRLFR